MKRPRRLTVVFVIFALIMRAYIPALGEDAIEDGLYTIGVSSDSKMFKVVMAALSVEDGIMTARLTLSGTGYGYLFQGTAAEADAAPEDMWSPSAEDWEGKYTYEIVVPALDRDVPVAGYSKKYEKWYDRTLVFFSNTLTEYDEVAPDGAYAGKIMSDTALDGRRCALTVKDGRMSVEMEAGADDGALNIAGADVSAGDGGYAFDIASLDKRIPVNLEGLAQEGWLKLASSALGICEVTRPDGEYDARVETDSNLLSFKDCRLVIKNGEMTALLTAQNCNFDYLYVGSAKDARGDEDGWIPAATDAEGNYTYEVKIPTLDNEIAIATFSAKKNMWYDRTMKVVSESLIEAGDEE